MLMFSEDQRYNTGRDTDNENNTQDTGTGGGGVNIDTALQELTRALQSQDNDIDQDNININMTHDIKWSLFITACHSFRRDTCLRPFPTMFMTQDLVAPKDFDALLDTVSKIPNFQKILDIVENPELRTEYSKPIELLHHILVQLDEPRLEAVDPKEIDDILKLVACEGPVCKPRHIFKVVASPDSRFEMKFQNLAAGKNTLYAFHGSRLENFYSILNHGLQQHMNKNMVFGPGIYLSSELSVSLPYSPGGFGWSGSNIGSKLSCVALCELIDTPDGVRCRKTTDETPENQQTSSRDSIGKSVPNKYYVVSNNDLVRVRYLMIYVNDNSAKQKVDLRLKNRGFITNWICNHKMLTMLVGYGVMLASIGLANRMPLQYYCRLLMRKLESSFKDFTFPSLN